MIVPVTVFIAGRAHLAMNWIAIPPVGATVMNTDAGYPRPMRVSDVRWVTNEGHFSRVEIHLVGEGDE